ncbi:MAG: NAD(P)/FAD-dependent oxidoreductase [Panacagrimonas sp.]
MSAGVAIIGAGLAALAVARTLRAESFDERIVMIGDESPGPYDRTTLSKSVLAGAAENPPPLAPASWYDEAGIELITGRRVVAIDPGSGTILFDREGELKAARIVLATGASSRRCPTPGADSDRVLLLRSLSDVRKLQGALRGARRIAIIGGGLIGCEVASTARKLGLSVVLVESSQEFLMRVLGPQVGRWCRSALIELGVECHPGCQVSSFVTRPDGITIECAGSADITADLALICVGAVPNDGLARQAGIPTANGVLVDAAGRTSVEGVYAAGDVACWPVRDSAPRSLETYLNSQDQGETVAKSILGRHREAPQEPRSWTEIAGHRIQVVGDFVGEGEHLTRGDLAKGSALIFRVREGRVVAALGVNVPKDFAIATRLVDARISTSAAALSDSSINLRSLLSAQREADTTSNGGVR